MEKLLVIDFSEIFRFAEKHYDISWNASNDIFFGNSLDYKTHTEIYPGDLKLMCSFYKNLKPRALDYSKKEVAVMSNSDKSYIILAAFMENNNITDDTVLIDCT